MARRPKPEWMTSALRLREELVAELRTRVPRLKPRELCSALKLVHEGIMAAELLGVADDLPQLDTGAVLELEGEEEPEEDADSIQDTTEA